MPYAAFWYYKQMIRIGPAGWSYPDWEQTVYPPRLPKSSQLGFIARDFPTIEINSSFYRVPSPAMAEGWCEKTASLPDFKFTLKAYRGWTHEGDVQSADVDRMNACLDILAARGRLGLLLFQFPYSFKPGPAAFDRLDRLHAPFRAHPCGIEVRHRAFDSDGFFDFLRERALSFANIDQPTLSGNLGPTCLRTAPAAYVRLHGRNAEKWFSHGETWERYNYLYSREELAPWAGRIRTLAKDGDVYVILNNHYRGQALKNARDLQEMLDVPPPPRQAFVLQ
jgi:uncharacterized protein YecE (DUF72 family)